MMGSGAIQDSIWRGFGNGVQLGCEERVISRGSSQVSDMHNGMNCGPIPKVKNTGGTHVCVSSVDGGKP